MKTIHTIHYTLASLLAAPFALAQPYTVRPVPAGLDTTNVGGFKGMSPIAADFLGNGRLQWYQGGSVISRFPAAGTITLPAITLPQTPTAYAVPLAAAVCDVDGDGDQDIVRINEWEGNLYIYTLQVFRNNGVGGFTTEYRVDWINSFPDYFEGRHYMQIVPGDFDKDGRIDLAVAESLENPNDETEPMRYEGKIYIRWNDGLGGFPVTATVEASGIGNANPLSVADSDRDGDLDIFCWRHTTFNQSGDGSSRARLYLNNGSRSAMTTYIFPPDMPGYLQDINGDGWPDLADAHNVALNNGAGGFGAPVRQYTGFASNALLVDHDGDGSVKAVFSDRNQLRIWTEPQQPTQLLATLAADIDGIGAADSDGDGDTDFLVSMENGTFAFVENRRLHTIPNVQFPGSVAISGAGKLCSADFNLDGLDDVVTVGTQGFWLTPTQSGGMPGTPAFKPTQSETPAAVVTADFDVDGRPDVAYALAAGSALRMARNTSDNSPQPWPDTAIVTDLTGVSMLATGSVLNPNGRPDLFTYATDSFIAPHSIRGYRQSSTGSWSALDYLAPSAPAVQALAVGNHNGASGDEIAFLGGGNSSRTIRGAMWLIGGAPLGGDGHTESVTGGTAPPYRLVWADTNGDSRREVVYINGSGGLSSWDPATGANLPLGNAPAAIRDIAAADWNQDGRTDIIAATADGLTIYHYQRHTQQWTQSSFPGNAGGYTHITIMNQNGDAYPDAAASTPSGRLDYIRNNPGIMSATINPVPVNTAPDSLATVITLPLKTEGYPAQNGSLADANGVLEVVALQFQEAEIGSGGNWIPGAPAKGSVLTQFVDSVSIDASGTTLMSGLGIDANNSGVLQIGAAAGAPTVPVAPGVTVNHTVHLAIRSTAVPRRFFVSAIGGAARQQDDTTRGSLELLNGIQPVLVTIQTGTATPLQQWRQTHFGAPAATGIAANDADPDSDGVPNLVEYFTGSNPRAAETALNATLALSVLPGPNAQSPVNLRVFGSTTALADPNLRVTIQSATTSLNSWSPFATRTGGGSWTGTSPQVLPPVNGRSSVLFTTTTTPQTTRNFFVRLKVEELP